MKKSAAWALLMLNTVCRLQRFEARDQLLDDTFVGGLQRARLRQRPKTLNFFHDGGTMDRFAIYGVPLIPHVTHARFAPIQHQVRLTVVFYNVTRREMNIINSCRRHNLRVSTH